MPDTLPQSASIATTGRRPLRIRRMTWETPGVVSLDLVAPDGSALPAWEPGAHLDLHLPGAPVRQYSLCGDPAQRDTWRVAVREVAGGRVSGLVHKALRPGALVEAEGPRNNFPLVPAPRYLFVAGGIGITPILPMLRAAKQAGAQATLLFCARSAAEAPFLDEAREFTDVVTHCTDDGTRLDVAVRLATPEADTLVYCCGPERLMNAVEQASSAWPEGSVRFEWFTPRSRPEGEGSDGFEVVCAQSGLTLTVAPGVSVLQALRDAGLDRPSSCEQGVCGTCECRVLEGGVDHRDSILSASERAANDVMMTCVSRAKGARLVLDI
ncbi:PDR/VanB family oxidoreductase [Roseomonas sp. AR75]|uniref:PDR/VanB family oxidoreductase n=1 Tax=Roseomonas sp. AR75 TaxID=2562311 RepID=UPI001484F5EC|nr:PDR/VanB family oxidoreductase [Roseomonas sp. AR75]